MTAALYSPRKQWPLESVTALVTGLALLPLVVGGARAGQEIEHPMAVVIVGGLLSSTALNLLVMPAFYLRWGAKRRRTAPVDTEG
jgi:Cu/Ag efflux pump CusA